MSGESASKRDQRRWSRWPASTSWQCATSPARRLRDQLGWWPWQSERLAREASARWRLQREPSSVDSFCLAIALCDRLTKETPGRQGTGLVVGKDRVDVPCGPSEAGVRSRHGVRRSSARSRSGRTGGRSRSVPRSSGRCFACCCCARTSWCRRRRLVDELWGERPPPRAVKARAGLRLAAAQGARRGRDRDAPLATSLRVDAGCARPAAVRGPARAGPHAARGRAQPSEAAGRAAGVRSALWRGPALAGLPRTSRSRATRSARLEELRLVALDVCGSRPTSRSAVTPRSCQSWRRSFAEHPLRERAARAC